MFIKGVNLGNWLVLEKWMSPHLFDGTMAEDEYYLPTAVKEAMADGATVKVLKTTSKWFGVTYREDREQVVASIKELTDKGEYKKGLWR